LKLKFKETHVKRFFVFATVVGLIFLGAGSLRAKSDPRIGTWKLNVAKSKATPGPLPASSMRTYTVEGSDIMNTTESVDANGKQTSQKLNVTADGKDRPTGAANAGTTLSVKLLGPGSYAGTSKKDGKVTSTNRAVISDGGKVFTITTKGTDGKVISTMVYDKQ
jgi:hypothetical protein